MLHQPISCLGQPWERGIPFGAAAILGGHAQRVPRLLAEKCLKPHADVVIDNVTPLDADLSYLVHPVKLLRQQDRITR
jgi:hypothetical protein